MQSLVQLYDEAGRALTVNYHRTRTDVVDMMQGQGLVEYALILALIAIVVIVGLGFFGQTLNNTFEKVNCNVYDASYSTGMSGNNCAP
jgi:Flp pilus assembly pilin Flp